MNESEFVNSAALLSQVESDANDLTKQLDDLVVSLSCGLSQMSNLTLDCTKVFANSVDRTTDAVHSSIKSLYALMAKCEEMSKSCDRLEPMFKEVELLKYTLDTFEQSLFITPQS